MTAQLALPSGGVVAENRGPAALALALKRYGDAFQPTPVTMPPRQAVTLRFPPDASQAPWQLQLTATSAVTLCGLQP
jgi:hypothetical protein